MAPAGDWEALRAAAANGADAVYFGLGRYSARQRATNFTLDELPDVLAYLHGRNVRGYVTFNTLIFSDELPEAAAYAAAIARAGADAVIVQDLGLARLVRRVAPGMPIHASTQMTLTEPRGLEWVRRLGVSRAILARELSLEAIGQIALATPMPLEVFVHGAICMSYSGQCLASESLWGRSANRGQCGQACRLPYQLAVDGRVHDLGDRAYLLSPKDLAAYDRVADLVRLGVVGLKIEGRMKSAAYVAVATRVYRAAIDAAVEGRPFTLSDDERRDLEQSFSRGFTHGFLDGPDHTDLVDGRFPKSRGVYVGRAAGATERGVWVEVDAAAGPRALKPGDGVVFDEGLPEGTEQGGRVFGVREEPGGGRRVFVTFGPDDLDPRRVSAGAAVWKTDDPERRREAEKSYAREEIWRRVPLSVRVYAALGQPLRIEVWDDVGNRGEAVAEAPAEAARKHPLTADLAREQFARLGDTPFELASVDLAGAAEGSPPDAVMAPKSVLNDLRRRAVAALVEAREARARHAVAEPDAVDAMRREVHLRAAARAAGDVGDPAAGQASRATLLYALVRTAEQLEAALEWSAGDVGARLAMVYIDMPEARDAHDAVARCRAAGVPAGVAGPRIVKPGEEKSLEALTATGADAVLVRNLATMEFLRERQPAAAMVGDFSLNVTNEFAADLLESAGLARVTAALDVNLAQLAALASRAGRARIETIVHLHMPMMHVEHCVAAAHLAQARDRRACRAACRDRILSLRDRVGAEHLLTPDAHCRSTLFSAHVQSGIGCVAELRRAGLRHFRVEFLREPGMRVTRVLDLYARALAGRIDAVEAWQHLKAMHPAGLLRGTWDFE